MMTMANDQLKAEFEATRRRVNAPCWVGEGWQQIIIDAVAKIEWLLSKSPSLRIEWHEIEEWHGSLAMRYRIEGARADDMIVKLIADVVRAAQQRADKACVTCGSASDGQIEFKGDELRVLCREHRALA